MAVSGFSACAVELARALLARYLVTHGAHRQTGSALGPSAEEVARALRAAPAPVDAAAEDARVAAAEAAVMGALDGAAGQLVRVFSLDRLETLLVAVLFSPEIDHDLERAFAFAMDDFTKKRADVGFLARLLGEEARARLDDGARLRRAGLVTSTDTGPASHRQMRLADRIVAFLRGQDTVDESVRDVVRIVREPASIDSIVMAPEHVARIRRALARPWPRVLLAGQEGTGRARAVEAVLAEQGIAAVRIDLAAISADRLAAALREAALRGAAAILDGGTAIGQDVPRPLAQAIGDGAASFAVPIVLTLASQPSWLAQVIPDLVEIAIPPPSFRERLELWRRELDSTANEADLETVAARYAFTGAVIARVARRARASAELRGAETLSLEDLGDAARLMFSHRLGGMAQRIPTGFTWDDLVLPKDTLEAVREVVRFARYKPVLLEDWGFAAKLPYGRGVSAILAGPPGTGKTMVAQLLAHELGYDLYRIDLSQVVNKYIGETEKNLARIFEEAETSHAVLFFDEADSLFSKRTEVKSSNDRYANLEVNYLLQRMETFDGVTLLATNLEQGLDDAFRRRVRFSIAFELPEEPERVRLWKSMFPPKTPLSPDIDWSLLARQFVMAGGYIKKAAIRAAVIAAEAGRPLTTADLVEAARNEYREMGRII
jgi:hypothetical protein